MRRVEVTLNRPNAVGKRRVEWDLKDGTEFVPLDNGLLVVENQEAGWRKVYNPHAWQSFYESGIEADDNNTEDADD